MSIEDKENIKIMNQLIKKNFFIMRSNYASIKLNIKVLLKSLILKLKTF